MYRRIKRIDGFSLLELMVTIAIAGIILGLGLPSFQSIMAKSNMAATNNALVYSVQLARSAAVERIQFVGVCASDNPLVEAAECGQNYAEGWFVYVDDNANGVRDANEEVLQRVDKPSNAFIFTPDDVFSSQIYFNDAGNSVSNMGLASSGIPVSGSIEIDYANGVQKRKVTIAANGRVSTETL